MRQLLEDSGVLMAILDKIIEITSSAGVLAWGCNQRFINSSNQSLGRREDLNIVDYMWHVCVQAKAHISV